MGDVKELQGYLKETGVYLRKSQRGRATGNERNVFTKRQIPRRKSMYLQEVIKSDKCVLALMT